MDLASLPNYGNRTDGTPKGNGYFGALKRPDGNVSTELSIGVNMDGKQFEIPALVPTLSHSEIQHLLRDGPMLPTIIEKAVQHAKSRMSAGQPVWALPDELYPMPTPALGGLQGQ